MNAALSDSRRKIVGGVLILGLVAIGSVLVWRGFGEGRVIARSLPPEGRDGTTKQSDALRHPEGPEAPKDLDPSALRASGRLRLPRNDGDDAHGNLLPTYGQAPDFILTERSGRSFSKSELLGKPWLANFIFTSCAGQCPFMSSEMSKLQGLFSKETPMQFVSFTVDPKRDTPEVLSEYADRYGAEKERWFFLTGPQPEIDLILKGFFLSPVEEPAMHSLYFILVDEKGELRGYYDSSEAGARERLIRDANVLVKSS